MNYTADERVVAGILRDRIKEEIFSAFGLPRVGWPRWLFGPVFWPPAQLFGRLMAGIDRTVREQGTTEAARRLLRQFVKKVHVEGAEHIPQEGPLLIASNHPGAYDSIAILASLSRKDIKIVVSDIPFLHSMPAASRLLVYATSGIQGRMTVVRGMMRQMQKRGALLIFPSGVVDPDPSFLPDAEDELGKWSLSLEYVMKRVPQTRLLVTIVSGVLAPTCLRNPLTRLMKEEWRQRKLAEFLQIIQQLTLRRKFGLTPRITFDDAITAADLLAQSKSPDLHQAIIERARQVMRAHMSATQSEGENNK